MYRCFNKTETDRFARDVRSGFTKRVYQKRGALDHFYAMISRVKIIFILCLRFLPARRASIVIDISRRDHEFGFAWKITISLDSTTRSLLDSHVCDTRAYASSFLPISIPSRFFRVDRSHVGICKATCHCGIVLLTQINCVRRIVRGRVRR